MEGCCQKPFQVFERVAERDVVELGCSVCSTAIWNAMPIVIDLYRERAACELRVLTCLRFRTRKGLENSMFDISKFI